MENAGEVPVDVTACCCACAGYSRVWSLGEEMGGGGGDAGLLPLHWSFSHQDMGVGCLEVVMRNQWNWDFLGGGVLFIFSLFGDSQLRIYFSVGICHIDLLFPFLGMMQNVWAMKNTER